MVLFNSPNIEFELAAALVACLEGLKLLVIKTPRSSSSAVTFNGIVPKWYL